MVTVAMAAWAANDVYEKKGGTLSGMIATKDSVENDSGSFFGRMYTFKTEKKSVVVGAVRGTAFESVTNGALDAFNDMQLAIGALPSQKSRAMRYAKEVLTEAKTRKAEVLFTGHSLGGGLVQHMSLDTEKPGVGFCSAGIKGLLATVTPQSIGKIVGGWAQLFGAPPLIRDSQHLAHILVNGDQVVGSLHHLVVGKRVFVNTSKLYKHSMDTLYAELLTGKLAKYGNQDAFDFVSS